MAGEQATLRIKAEKLGTVTEIRQFLSDLEAAYNSIYLFIFLVDTLVSEAQRKEELIERRFQRFYKYYPRDEKIRLDPFFYELFLSDSPLRKGELYPNLMELFSRIDLEKLVPSDERLYLSKINIQSPGFWEVIGSLNPLQQIREYLKDRHERKKDNEFRNDFEKRKAELELLEKEGNIIKERIELLKSLGYSDLEVRPLVSAHIAEPLRRLGAHQERGLIDYPEHN